METTAKVVAEDLSFLQSDVNSMLESLWQPATVKEGKSRLNRVRVRLKTLEQFISMNKPYPDDSTPAVSHQNQHAGSKKHRYERNHKQDQSDSDYMTSSDSS